MSHRKEHCIDFSRSSRSSEGHGDPSTIHAQPNGDAIICAHAQHVHAARCVSIPRPRAMPESSAPGAAIHGRNELARVSHVFALGE